MPKDIINKRGKVLFLREDIPEAQAGYWLVVSVGNPCRLCQLKENLSGTFDLTDIVADIAQAEMSHFETTESELTLPAECL